MELGTSRRSTRSVVTVGEVIKESCTPLCESRRGDCGINFTFVAENYIRESDVDDADNAEEGSWVFVEEVYLGRRSRRQAG